MYIRTYCDTVKISKLKSVGHKIKKLELRVKYAGYMFQGNPIKCDIRSYWWDLYHKYILGKPNGIANSPLKKFLLIDHLKDISLHLKFFIIIGSALCQSFIENVKLCSCLAVTEILSLFLLYKSGCLAQIRPMDYLNKIIPYWPDYRFCIKL